ncbi:hypothetical protein ACFOY8_18190 [Thalassospira xianhensis]|uniref:Uncharacterized protein n=1 Tax=Thalassospira xianhensis MCCC 1A02616 TaxID=1177929 RepID=A0A367U6D3_9PROT|nr:hypothetical protein [Thalassospira xianhensis]RCK03581.1 hypothetical protein TH5_24655 [Thalassospira xianhensis MCCC 1A02616]
MDYGQKFCLSELNHLNLRQLQRRKLNLMPLWENEEWHLWFDVGGGKLMRGRMVDAAHSLYAGKQPAKPHDLLLPFLEFGWQRASWPEVCPHLIALENDFHLLCASVAKLDHFFDARQAIDPLIISSFVQSEIEFVLTVSRSVFDLLQQYVSWLWNNTVELLDEEQEKIRKQNKLPEKSFQKVIFKNNTRQDSEQITRKYVIPDKLAQTYEASAEFFEYVRHARTEILHGLSASKSVLVTDTGFCVKPNEKPFHVFEWPENAFLLAEGVSLRAWLSFIIQNTIGICNSFSQALSETIQFPEAIMPGHKIFIRDPSSSSVEKLIKEQWSLRFRSD